MAKILVVDDQPDIVRGISIVLKAEGHEVLTAMDGLQATNLAIKENPDLVILDIGMPAGDGHVVVERLRKSSVTMSTPVVFLTARTTQGDMKKALDQGVEKYITKPFDNDELRAAVAELLG